MLRIVPWLAVLGTHALSGCSDLPRFSGYEWYDLVPDDGKIAIDTRLVEIEDFPNTPERLPLLDLEIPRYYALAIDGSAQPPGILTEAPDQQTFDQCPDATTLPGLYSGDVDFLRLKNPGGTVCLLIELDQFWSSSWDLIAYEYRDDCITGDFLTRHIIGDATTPSSTVVGGCPPLDPEEPESEKNHTTGCNFFTSDADEIALYITGALGENPPNPMGYTVYAYPTTYPAGCAGLVPERFVGPNTDTGTP
ncbi:MAG: hypothetical protein ABMA64_35850 [Myxococcota bacterium]